MSRPLRFAGRVLFPALLSAGVLSLRHQERAPIHMQAGDDVFEWVRGWGKLPEGMHLGNTHGCIVVDSQDRVYLNTDGENAVVVFDAAGKFLKSWGKELVGGLHGMALVREGQRELLLLTHIGRHQVFGATLEGEILWTLDYPKESGVYPSAEEYKPTSIAPAPDGGFFVADGYGASWIHRYDKDRKYVKSFGGPGTELGKLRCPHGLWLETRDDEPTLLVADRENHRLQVFDLEGNPLSEVKDNLRRPCHMHPFGLELAVADLAGRVTILDRTFALVGHLGDNPDEGKRARNDVPPGEWRDGEFVSPHCASWDSRGNLYVTDWLSAGRISKLARVK